MRAVWLKEFGAPEVLQVGDAPDPIAGEGHVVVAVEFVNITFVETQFRSGMAGPFSGTPLPVIPGNGVGGRVRAVGPDVSPALVGLRVVTATGGAGGYAERVAVPAAGLVPVPDEVAMDDAVALLSDGRTAMLLVRDAELRAGERVLVEAAAGGLGSLLVQLANNAGTTVVAAAGGTRKLEVAGDLGAAFAVDYTAPDWAEQVRAAVGAVDVVFDGVGGAIGAAAFDLVATGGRMLSFGMASGTFTSVPDDIAVARRVTIRRGVPITPELSRQLTQAALAEASAGRLHPVIGQRLPLADAAAAHAAIEARATIGKTLLVP